MSTANAEKEIKKQAEMQFVGQESEEARHAVKLQRELKKKKDALRKAEKKLKSLKPEDAAFSETEQLVEDMKKEIAQLEKPVPTSLPPADATVSTDTTKDSSNAREKEEKKKAEMQFVGQESEEARHAVKLQRELKKKKDALRKAEKKLKSLKPEDADFAKVEEEIKTTQQAIAAMESSKSTAGPAGAAAGGDGQPEASGTHKVVSEPMNATAAAAPAVTITPPPAEVDEAKEAADRQALHDLVAGVMQRNRGECTVVQRRNSVVHPRVAEAAVLMEGMVIVGGDARTMAMISAFRELIKSTSLLSGSSLKDTDITAFEKLIETNFAFLRRRREATSGMRYVKEVLLRRLVALRDEIVHLDRSRANAMERPTDPREVALQLVDMIESELRTSIKSIVEDRSLPYVSNSDTILLFGRSSVVELILLSRARDPQRVPKKVIVLDSAPLYEGRDLARKLSEVGIPVTYGLITACCTLMPKCTRVFIGASSVLQNGDVFSRCGTALVAACAKSFRKPVLCFSASDKFVPEVWLGNLAQNTKLMDIRSIYTPYSDSGASYSPLVNMTPNSRSPHYEGASGYLYDLTPAAYVDVIVCEMGCLHTSAIVAALKDREGRDASPLMYMSKN